MAGTTSFCGALRLAEIAARRRAGETNAELAAAAGVCVSTMQSYLQRHRLTGKHGGARTGDGWQRRHAASIPTPRVDR